jgi:hypothetical protein
MIRCMVGRMGCVALVAVALAGCSGGSSSPSSGAASAGGSSGGPQETDFDRYKASAPVAVRYARALAVGNMDTADGLTDQGSGAAANALTRLEQRVKAIPIAAAQVRPDYRSGIKQYGPDFATVPVTIQVKLSHAAPTEWVLLGHRALLMHRDDGGSWKVAGDVTAAAGVDPGGMFLYTHPTLLSGTHTTVVYGPGSARDEAQEILRQMDASSPGLTARYGGAAAAQRPLVFVVNDREQGQELSGRELGSEPTPLGTLDGNVVYVYLRPYQHADAITRDASTVYLMTLLAGRFNLLRAPWSLAVGVAGYEQNEYLNTKGYILPLEQIQAAYPGYPSAAIWRSQDKDWGLSGSKARLAAEDAVAVVHVIVANHGGSAAIIRLGKQFKGQRVPPGSDFSPAQVRKAFQTALGVSYDQVLSEAHSYVAGGSWKFG